MQLKIDITSRLPHLGLSPTNPGVWSGSDIQTKSTAPKLISESPITASPIASVLMGEDQEYEKLVKASADAAEKWKQVPAPKRGEIVRIIGLRLRQKKEALAWLISVEMGKSLQEALGEVQEMIDMADFAVGQSRMLYGHTMHSERENHRMYEQWHPYGVIGVFSAFNFPVAVWAWNAFIAVICGNTVIWKPSSKTPLCAIAVQKICADIIDEEKIPPIFSLWIPANHTLAERMIDDKRLSLISFTGSTAVGRLVAQRVAKRLAHCLLELGGNNAIIVDETANLDLAINAIVFGAIGTAGQRCTTTRRVFLHESIYESMVDRLLKAYGSVRIGSPLDEKNHMGPLIDEAAVKQYLKAIDEIRTSGGRIVYGGKALKEAGYYVAPTLIKDVQADWDIVQRETFAPILYLMPYTTLEQAVALQNQVPQGLSSSLFTQRLSHAEYFLSVMGSDCGIANINIGTSGAEIGGAFGGEKDTGGGREAGSDSWRAYMRRQTNTINWGNILPLAQGISFDLRGLNE